VRHLCQATDGPLIRIVGYNRNRTGCNCLSIKPVSIARSRAWPQTRLLASPASIVFDARHLRIPLWAMISTPSKTSSNFIAVIVLQVGKQQGYESGHRVIAS